MLTWEPELPPCSLRLPRREVAEVVVWLDLALGSCRCCEDPGTFRVAVTLLVTASDIDVDAEVVAVTGLGTSDDGV